MFRKESREERQKEGISKGHEEAFRGMMGIFFILIMLVVLWVYTYVSTYQSV